MGVKDWRDAFIERFEAYSIEKADYSMADAIKVKNCGSCTYLRPLMKYILQFKNGGLWYSRDGLFFVTKGNSSDKKATYKGAIKFIKKIEENL